MKTCKTCKHKRNRKIFTGPSRRYDYDFQNVCGFGLKKLSSYAKVVSKRGVWCEACDNYSGSEESAV